MAWTIKIEKMKYMFYIIIISMLFKCGLSEKVSVNEDNNLEFSSFNNEQNSGLNMILKSFDSYLEHKMNTDGIDLAYTKYFKMLLEFEDISSYYNSIYELDSISNLYLLKMKKIGVYSDIWDEYIETSIKTNQKRTVIEYNFKGKYWKLIKKKLSSYKIYNGYFDDLEEMGDISPPIVLGFPNLGEKANFSDEYVRFFVLIHFITVVENMPQKLSSTKTVKNK